jgi:hypothetical protein
VPAPGEEQPVGTSAARARSRLLSIAVGVAVLALGGWLVARNADDLRRAAADIGVGAICLSGALAVAGTVLIGQVWLVLLRGLGVSAQRRDAFGVFFVSQLGKYLPGSVWPVIAQMEFGRRWGAPRRVMLTANILMLAVVAATGLTVGAALLSWSSNGGLARYGWALVFLVPLLACLHPRVIPAALDLLLRAVGREPLRVQPTGRSMLAAMACGFAVWLVMGLHLLVMTQALGADGPRAVAAAVGGMGLGWAAGLLFIPAPAGAGVRDAVLVATFAPQIGTSEALVVALASRVLLLLADVVLAAVGAAVRPGTRGTSRGGSGPPEQ